MRRSIPFVLLIFAAGAIVGSRLGGAAPAPASNAASVPEAVVMPSDVALDPWVFDPIASGAPTAPGCDETEQMMAAMFGALARQALDNAGKDPDELNAAVAGDREAFTAYLAALGIAPDDPRVEAMLGAAFPTTSALPQIAPAC